MLGRIVKITEDGYIAINIPAKAKNIDLAWQGKKPILRYKLGKETKTSQIDFQNMPVLKGSYFVGSFDGNSYDKECLAELMDLKPEDVTDETHINLLQLLHKGNIFFTNPHPKPKPSAAKESAEYVNWKTANDSLWEQAAIIYLSDPVREAEEKRLMEKTNPKPKVEEPVAETREETKDEKKSAEKEAAGGAPVSKEEEEDDVIESKEIQAGQEAVLLANELFEAGFKDTIGLAAALKALREKGLTHDGFKKTAFSLFKHAFYAGKYSELESVKPVREFLTSLLDRTVAGKENMKSIMGLDADTEKQFDDDIKKITDLIAMITPVKND